MPARRDAERKRGKIGQRYETAGGAVGTLLTHVVKPNSTWPMASNDDPVLLLRSESGTITAAKLSRCKPVTP